MSDSIPNSTKQGINIRKTGKTTTPFDIHQIKLNEYIDPAPEASGHKKRSNEQNRVEKNSAVLMHFTLRLEDGSIAESSRASGRPVLFCLGDQSLSPMLEAQLLGLKVSDKKTFTLPALAAFGERKPELVQHFSKRDFINTAIPTVLESTDRLQGCGTDERRLADSGERPCQQRGGFKAQGDIPEVGTIMLFTAINGHEIPGIVYKVMEDTIMVDFNHPLAGRSVNFDIDILAIHSQGGKKNENMAG